MSQLTCPPVTETSIADIKESRPVIILTSPSAYKIVKKQTERWNIEEIVFIESSDLDAMNRLVASLRPVEGTVFYAIGAGQVCDMGRYVAAAHGRPLYCVPTALSSDAFLVDSSGVRTGGCVTYVPTCYAKKIYVDWDLLQKSGDLSIAGCGDILSIYTALIDWQNVQSNDHFQEDEKYDAAAASVASSILEGLITSAHAIKKRDKAGMRAILLSLLLEVNLCNFYGNSRPEEGGEHFFAYCIEDKMPHFMHGQMLAFSVMLTSFLQGGDWRRIKSFLDIVELDYIPEGLGRDLIFETLQELPAYCSTHNLRYSVYSELDFLAVKSSVESFLKEIGVS